MSKMRRYMFTLNNPEIVPLNHESIPKDIRYMVYQLERGEQNGTLHLQGYCELFKPQRISFMKKFLTERVHLEAAKGTREGCRAYCMKEGTRVEGPWEYGVWIEQSTKKACLAESMKRALEGETLENIMKDDPESYSRHKGALKKARSLFHQQKFYDKYKELSLRPWQEDLLAKLEEEPDDRKIFWIHGSKGGEGKSTFGKHLVSTRNAFLFNGGRNEDIIFAYDYQNIVVLDAARCQDIRYDIIEHFKDGVLFNQKYESHAMYLTPVHVIIMSNVYPDVSKISEDRIILIDLDLAQ